MVSLLTVVVGILILGIFGSSAYSNTIVLLIILSFMITFTLDICRSYKYKHYQISLTVALVFRVFLLLYDCFTNNPIGLPELGGPLTSDNLGFYSAAVKIANGQHADYGGLFSYMMGKLFSITTPNRLLGEFIIMLFSIMTMLVNIDIFKLLNISTVTANKIILILGLLPNYAILSVNFRRESPIIFLISLSLLFFLKWMTNNEGYKSLILAVAVALVASIFHGATGLISIGYIVILMVYSPSEKKYILKSANLIGAFFLFISFAWLFSNYGDTFFDKLNVLSSGKTYSVSNLGDSSYAEYVGDSSSIPRMLIFQLPRYIFFMFSPLPFQWRGLSDVISFMLDSAVYLYIVVKSLKSVKQNWKSNEEKNVLIAILIISIFVAFIFSWGVTNTGTAIRHRDKFISLYMAMFALVCAKQDKTNEVSKSGI